MIKSKINAREKALELSVKCYPNGNVSVNEVIQTAESFYLYLVGGCELPEQEPSAEEIVNQTVDKYLETFNAPKKEPFNTGAIGIIGDTKN